MSLCSARLPGGCPKRILVTGGVGITGANFVHETKAHRPDGEVTVLDALTYASGDTAPTSLEGQIACVERDITDAGLVDSLVAGTDLVVHFAAESQNDNLLNDPTPFVQTNAMGHRHHPGGRLPTRRAAPSGLRRRGLRRRGVGRPEALHRGQARQPGRIGGICLIGANGERNNKKVVRAIFHPVGRPKDDDHVTDRLCHDMR